MDLGPLSPQYLLAALILLSLALTAHGQTTAATRPAAGATPTGELEGRTVEDVRIIGNTSVSTAIIRNAIRTRAGEPFNAEVVQEDYQRIFALKKFANVEARAERTERGVIVIFEVTEQRQINQIRFIGNQSVETKILRDTIDLEERQSIDRFRIAIARESIQDLYKERNFPFAHVEVLTDPLMRDGNLVFQITEGPASKVRKVDFIGNHLLAEDRLRGQILSKAWVFVLRPGTFDPDQINDDVAALQRFYESKGFFDARVGRKILFSPDMKEMQVNFLIEEGPRYKVGRVAFRGNVSLSEAELRRELRLLEGEYYDADVLRRDIREIVRGYSPYGFIYEPQSRDPEFLQIGTPAEPVKMIFHKEAGTVDLVYEISEGKPFRLGRIIVKGNQRTQDKVVLREMRLAPGDLYRADRIQDATERLRATPYFTHIEMTPIGDDPEFRDLLVEVEEAKTAMFNIGTGINSNGGVGANITYEQRNFDIKDWPQSWDEAFSDRALIGAGQSFRASIEPGTQQTNASIRFHEPYIFDQPYSFTGEAYLRQRDRRDYDETRTGGRVSFGKRFNYVWSSSLTLRGEDVEIDDIEDLGEFVGGVSVRAPEIVDAAGHNTVTSAGIQIRRDTTTRGLLPSDGSVSAIGWESFGALGGDFTFQKFTASWDGYFLLHEDLLERKTILSLHVDSGAIVDDAPFFERFYGGGLGSIRGFRFRGISPRAGLEEDAIGGEFSLAGSAEVGFPIAGDTFRGVVFVDAGTVEEEVEIDRIRTSVGAGIRLVIPFFGPAPMALDFAVPLGKDDQDETQLISFSFGFLP